MSRKYAVTQDVIKATADLGWTGLQLSELDADTEAAGSGAAAKAGTGGRGGAPEADEALLLAQLREQLTQRLRQQPAQPPPEIVACLKVCLVGAIVYRPSAFNMDT